MNRGASSLAVGLALTFYSLLDPGGNGRTATGGSKQNLSCHLSPGSSLAAWKTSYGTTVEGARKVHAESLH